MGDCVRCAELGTVEAPRPAEALQGAHARQTIPGGGVQPTQSLLPRQLCAPPVRLLGKH